MSVHQSNSKTESEKIWEDIKHIDLKMFGLSNQTVQDYCTVSVVEPSKLYLTAKASAVLPALESAVSEKYAVESQLKWIVVSRKV